ncbi:MAG: deoxyribodipyrimidine photo-lyase [Rickettsiaceae bacterium]|nr:MAG: deoxyribodipyrimidine photo-lyase [Rickettsiaceae bacterium]
MVAVVWFRNDLRLTDHLALDAAIRTKKDILPIYIYDKSCSRPLGSAAKWWLHHSLTSLKKNIRKCKADIILREGDAFEVLKDIYNQTEFTHIFWHDRYDQNGQHQDQTIKEYFESKKVDCQSFNGSLLFGSMNFRTKEKKYFKVFSPFWKHCLKHGHIDEPIAQPSLIKFNHNLKIQSNSIDSWHLLPKKPNWAKGFRDTWTPGELGAQKLLKEFLNEKLSKYKAERDQPAALAISDLSPHIRWGEISPKQMWHKVKIKSAIFNCENSGECFLRQLGWREFNYYTLHHNPEIVKSPLKKKFEHFPWHKDKLLFEAWARGKTGYPLIDAGMRQLWKTGYMHNRVRLVVASFLTKNLLISWQEGEEWFWDTLVDADLASNPFNWQWVAGCGTDAAPYFRVFNSILQSKKFDNKGEYIRYWIPELRDVSNKFVHSPWLLKEKVKNYPEPIIDYYESRTEALETFYNLP